MTSTPDALQVLGPTSYTAHRLQHATPEHVHLTSRRCFIGPIPEGWLQSHRRDWYKHHLRIHYSSRAATFTAGPNVGKHRRLTGIDGPSAIASYGHSFPQPGDLEGDNGDEVEGEEHEQTKLNIVHAVERHDDDAEVEHAEVTTALPPAVEVPRAKHTTDNVRARPEVSREGSSLHEEGLESSQHIVNNATEARSKQKDVAGVAPLPSEIAIHQDSAQEHAPSLSSSTSTVKPTGARLEAPKDSQGALKDASSSSQFSIQASRPNPEPPRRYSQSSDSAENIWLSPPTSRIPSSRDSPVVKLKQSRSGSQASFVTANEEPTPNAPRLQSVPEVENGSDSSLNERTLHQSRSAPSQAGGRTITPPSSRQSSHASLLQHGQQDQHDGSADRCPLRTNTNDSVPPPEQLTTARTEDSLSPQRPRPSQDATHSGLVRFEDPGDEEQQQRMMNVRMAQMKKRHTFKRLRRETVHDGQIIKIENMLVRLEHTLHKVPDDFTENDSEKIETTVIERWKEFMCVCRESDDEDSPFVLQLYKSRVIPAMEKTRVKKRYTHEIQLRRSNCHINLYSPLDKTMAVWHPSKRGTMVYTMQCRCGADSMEWYTFLRNVLGLGRTPVLQVHVPDLAVNLRIEKPFEILESARHLAQAANGDEQAILRTMKEEQAATSRIVERCMEMLNQSPDWRDVLRRWKGTERMGLAWKRYDRLEWVHGANEKKMYGTIGMENSHDLELRPKQHYPTSVNDEKRQSMTEPAGIEGFLIRLTSQRGVDQKLGKLFFKRLYFSTHNQFLVFNRPARADPPPPPRLPMTESSHIPSADQIAQKTPLIYSVNPYALKEGQIEWLSATSAETPQQLTSHDRDAFDENHRRLGLLHHCDGLINLCNVVRVRRIRRGATPADDRVDSGSEVEFDQPVPNTTRDDGSTQILDDSRVFELVLRNGLIVRLQAYDRTTKREWMTRLRDLVRYWKLRTTADVSLYKSVRAQNIERLNIDERSEAYVGQFAHKWEVTTSYASPELYNMCGVSCCRSVHIAGHLYHKPRLHGVFKRLLCLLSHGKLLMFADAVRGHDGRVIKHIHHERVGTLDLRECYVYSGLTTASDLLYSGGLSQYDKHKPGRHGLPRIWMDDGWTSIDEDTSTCFVIWHGKKSGWFRSQDDTESAEQRDIHHGADGVHLARHHTGEEGSHRDKGRQRLRRVRKLGTEGKSIVFRARSRAERDHWVLSIGMEIERLHESDDVRLVGEGPK